MEVHKRIQLKPRLRISNIGKLRFWIGIGLGILNAIVFFGFVFYFFEVVNTIRSAISYDIPFQSEKELVVEKLLLFSIAIALGINMAVRYWFLQPTFYFHRTRKNLSLRIANYSLFIEFLTWYMTVVFIRQVLLNHFLVGTRIYEYHGYIFFIIPIYLFLSTWTEISRYVKVWKWKLYTFFTGICLLLLASFIDISNYQYSETVFQKIYEEELFYVDSEIALAKEKYQIEFDPKIVTILKRLRTHELRNLLITTKNAFQKDEKVSMKQILIEKILLHNFKSIYFEGYSDQLLYANPIAVYHQLKKVEPTADEANELLNILEEFHQLTFFMSERLDTKDKSITFQNKVSRLANTFSNSYGRFNSPYRTVYAEIKIIVYGLQKQDQYEHPFVTTIKGNMYAPPIPLDSKYGDEYPELRYELKN